MPEQRSNRVNVLLDDEHATKLHRLADRTHLNAGTLARSLLSTALDQADPDAATVTALLDVIPGAFQRAQQGLLEAQAGRVVRLEDL
ncbi:MAG: hypothetical protein WCH74_10365 [Chloroflexota bacterium]